MDDFSNVLSCRLAATTPQRAIRIVYQTDETDRQTVVREVGEARLIQRDTLTIHHVLFDRNHLIVDREKVVRKVR